MKTNTLSLSFRQEAATEKSPAFLVAELRIDDKIVGEGFTVDIRCLANALVRDGEHFIFTCGCGHAGCVGIHEGFRSWIEGDIVAVEGNLPEGVECSWKLSATQAKAAVVSALKAIRPIAESMASEDWFPIGPDGFGRDGIVAAEALLVK